MSKPTPSLKAFALQRARITLEKNLGIPVSAKTKPSTIAPAFDGELVIDGRTFLVKIIGDMRNWTLAHAVDQIQSFLTNDLRSNVILIVPTMNKIGETESERALINWIDLRGNADIREDGLRLKIRGMRDEIPADILKPSGLNPFSKKAGRIVEILLSDPKRPWTRLDLIKASRLDKGFVSKIIAELLNKNYVVEDARSARNQVIRVRNPLVLLDAWAERYQPAQPVSWSLIAGRDGFETTHKVAAILNEHRVRYAITGLSAAAEYTGFGNFRRVDVYVSEPLPDAVLVDLPMDIDGRGRNVFIHLDDLGAILDIDYRGEHRTFYASAVRVYLDLAALPERAAEAREEMRNYLIELWK